MKIKELFEAVDQFLKTREEIEAWLQEMEINSYTINDDLSVDVGTDVELYNKKLNFIPVKFGKVDGGFDCSFNNLLTLKGSPREVGGEFDCFRNRLTSLQGAPREVGGDFDCSYNKLTSLKGSPREVGGHFDCSDNNLTSLDGIGHVEAEIFSDLSNPK